MDSGSRQGILTNGSAVFIDCANERKKEDKMITIEKLLEILQEDLTHKKRFVTTEVYDGDGNRDIFQEGYNYGHEQFLEEVIETINRGGRIK